uniref:Putative terminase n=2 Tax=viral metagenome TaxID=1070528 RepID=A0A6M3IZF1_9ZZZZ
MDIVEALRPYYNNFDLFIEKFLGKWLTSKVPEFHREIYKLIPAHKRLVIAAPRGFAKSTIISRFYPLWLALFAKAKDITIISASETLAIGFLRDVKREIETNQLIKEIWGDQKTDKWTENHIILKTGVTIRARGAGGQIRGFRPDTIICDDIETDESVESEEQRKKIKDWLFKACLNTLLPEGQFIIIGTIIHPLSVLADLLVMDNKWEKRKYQAYKNAVQESGNELWGELWTHAKLQERKAEIGSWAFSSEYLNNPISNETAPVKDSQIRYWTDLPKQYSCVIAVDPAYSDDETADYKVASVVAIDQSQNRYLLQYVRTHAPIGEFQDSIINLFLRYKATLTGVGIPNSGVEKAFFESFLRKCEERKLLSIPVVELKNTFTNSTTGISARNKKSRIVSSLQPLFEQGKYYIHGTHIEARDELLTIGSSRWDDIVDSLAYAEQILQPVFYDASGKDDYWHEEEKIDRGDSGYGL